MAIVISLVLGMWLFYGGGVWWLVGILVLSAMVFIGEDLILRWMFFISVVSGTAWLFFRLALGIEL